MKTPQRGEVSRLRGSNYEVPAQVPFLRAGAFDTQGIVTVPMVGLVRPLGTLSSDLLKTVEKTVASGSD